MIKNPDILAQIGYVALGAIGTIVSIIYGLVGGDKFHVLKSIGMIIIGGFIGWLIGGLTNNVFAAGASGAIAVELMHIIKKEGPEVIKEKIKNLLPKN